MVCCILDHKAHILLANEYPSFCCHLFHNQYYMGERAMQPIGHRTNENV